MTISRIHPEFRTDAEGSMVDPQPVTELAVSLPSVVWAIAYWPSEDGVTCPIAAMAGSPPTIMDGFSLPLDRLPPPIVRAMLNDTIEHGRFSVLWLQDETRREVSEDDLALLKGLTVVPLRQSDGRSVLLLLGTDSRNPDPAPFREFRARIEGRQPTPDGSDASNAGKLQSEALQMEFHMLARDATLFRARLAVELARAQRYVRNLSLITFTIEDIPGHALEHALDELAKALRRQLRLSDLVGRCGNSTMGVVLPEANESHALWVGPRLTAVAHESLAAAGWRANVTVGLAARPSAGDSPESFIARSINTQIWSE